MENKIKLKNQAKVDSGIRGPDSSVTYGWRPDALKISQRGGAEVWGDEPPQEKPQKTHREKTERKQAATQSPHRQREPVE